MAQTLGTAYVNILPSTADFGDGISSALGTAAKVTAGAVTAATTAVTAFTKESVNAGMAFDSSMSQVAATMGFTIEELNTEGSAASQTMQQLSDFAQQMGSTTAFSASEAADALNYMALAGYDAETSMTMLPTVLDLAAAGGIDLASASDMVTDAQSALGLTLEETAIMVDQMAAASSKSNTSVEQLGDAFLTIGANAKVLSGGTQELSTALGILADNGIKGTEGGTHLRNILLAMNPTTDAAAAAWEQLGVSAYDAEGNLRPLEDVFGELSEAMDGMSDQERQNIVTSMFNKTDLAAVNALLDTSADRWTELGGAIDASSGAASAMAEVQLDNLEGDITLFKSALEGFQIMVSDQVTPSLREFVQFGSDGLSRLTEAFNTGGLTAAMAELGTIISEGLNAVIEALPEAINAGMELLGAIGQGIIDNLPTILSAAEEIISQLLTGLISNLPTLLQAALEILVTLANDISSQLPTMIPAIVDIMLNIVNVLIDNLPMLIDAAIVLIVALADGLIAALPQLMEKAPEIIQKLVAALTEEIPELILCAMDLLMALAGGLIDALPELVLQIPTIIKAITDGLLEGIADFIVTGGELIEGLWQGISDKSDWIIGKIKSFGEEVLQGLKDFFNIGSPSKLLRDEVGQWLPAGMAVGIEANADSVTDAMEALSEDTLEATGNLTGATFGSASYTYGGVAPTENDKLMNLLMEYLPIIANGQNVNVTLEGDAENLFSAVQRQNNIYRKQTGSSAFA
jgi:TP901 family phage tail tape measure protein